MTGKRSKVAPSQNRLLASPNTRSAGARKDAEHRSVEAIRASVERSPTPVRVLPAPGKADTVAIFPEVPAEAALVSDSEGEESPVMPTTPRMGNRHAAVAEPRTPTPKHRRRLGVTLEQDEEDEVEATFTGPIRDSPTNPFLSSTPPRYTAPRSPGANAEKPTITYVL